MLKLPEKLKLYLDQWVCQTKIGLGRGSSQLLNKEGYLCCVGQWSIQAGATKNQIIGKPYPSVLSVQIDGLSTPYVDRTLGFADTIFAHQAMDINDKEEFSIENKIELLTKLCNNYGYELEIINVSGNEGLSN